MKNWKSLVVSLWSDKYENDNYINENAKVYRTFGHHDLLSVTPINGNTAISILEEMIEQTNSYSNSINAGESIQNIFAVTDNDKCNLFWNNERAYVFMSSLQIDFRNSKSFRDDLNSFKRKLEQYLINCKLKKYEDFFIYDTLDCNDVLLFIKSDLYSSGADIIHNITMQLVHKHHSYSVCGIETSLINNKNEIIPKVIVCAVLEDPVNYSIWFNEFIKEYPICLQFGNVSDRCQNEENDILQEEYIHMARLGNEDICINIFNCHVSHFIEMITNKNGVFCSINPKVKLAFSKMRIQLDSNIDLAEIPKARNIEKGISIIDYVSNEWKNNLKKYANPYVFKAISEVFASVKNLEINGFAFDVQDCFRNVFPLFTKKINDYEKFISSFSIHKFNDDLISFINGIMSIANGSLHADKLFINVPGFNAVLCDAPSKLLVYYTSYIQRLVVALNDGNKFDYRFILCPDLYLGIEIVPLFYYCSEDSQLLKARVPINKLYEPQNLLMELSHEAAHFVGSKTRKRFDRVEYLVKSISYIFADKLLRPVKLHDEKSKLEWEILSEFVPKTNYGYKELEDLFRDEWKHIPDFIYDKLIGNIEIINEEYYLDDVKTYLKKAAIYLFSDELFDELINEIFETITNETSQIESTDSIFLLMKIIERHKNEVLLGSIENIINYSCNLCSESFADLVMLYITKDPKAYLLNIYNAEKNDTYNVDGKLIFHLKYFKSVERIISVFSIFEYDINSIEVEEDSDFYDFLNIIKDYYTYLSSNGKFSSKLTIESNIDYLKSCLLELEKNKEVLDELSILFRSVNSKNIGDCLEKFQECAFEFRLNLLEKNNIDNTCL